MHLDDGTIIIRDLEETDRDAYVDILSDPRVSGSLRGTVRPGGPQVLLSDCSRSELHLKFGHTRVKTISGKPCHFAVALGSTGGFIGSAGSYPIEGQSIGLSYWIEAGLHGQGIGSRILRLYCPAALKYFTRERIIANIARDNPASRRAVINAGFTPSRIRNDPGFGSIQGRELFELAY